MTLRYFFGGRIMDIRIGYIKKNKMNDLLIRCRNKQF